MAPVFPGLALNAYAVMLALAFAVGLLLTLWCARGEGLPRRAVWSIYAVSVLGALVGARLLFALVNLNMLASAWDLRRGGMVAYGGMGGGCAAAWAWCRGRGLSFLRWADAGAPAVALGTGIARIGCLLYGCDYGARTGLPWGITFPRGSPAWIDHVADAGLPFSASRSFPVHPTQVYESLLGFALFATLMIIRRRPHWRGQLFVLWALGYGLGRPLIEIVRADDQRGGFGGFSTSQLIGAASALAAACAWVIHLVRAYAPMRAPEFDISKPQTTTHGGSREDEA